MGIAKLVADRFFIGRHTSAILISGSLECREQQYIFKKNQAHTSRMTARELSGEP